MRIFGVVLDHSDWVCMLMELAELGSLRQQLFTRPEAVVGQAHVQITIARDVASGLAYLHARKPTPVIHRDVKSAEPLGRLDDAPRQIAPLLLPVLKPHLFV